MAEPRRAASDGLAWPRWLARAIVASAATLPFLPLLWAWYGADDFYFVDRLTHLEPGALAVARAIFIDNLGTVGGFYRPLAMLSLYIDLHAGGGLAFVPHLVNVLLHAATSVAVFALARRLAPEGRGLLAAVLAAVAFAVFPRRVEAVAWVSCRPDLLATLLVVLAARAACESSAAARVATVTLWTASLLSKESTALMPVALLAVRALTSRQGTPPRWRPWVISFGVAGILTVLVRRVVVGEWIGGYRGQDALPGLQGVVIAAKHLAYSFVPAIEQLADPLRSVSVNAVVTAVMAAFVAAIGATAWRLSAQPGMRAGIAWFAAAVVPVLTFAPSLSSPLNDRLMYLPGVAIALGVSAIDLAARRSRRRAVVVVVLCMAVLTALRAGNWPRAGAMTRSWLTSLGRLTSSAPASCRIYIAGGPDSFRGAYMLRSGWDWGLAHVGKRPDEGRVQPLALYYLAEPSVVPIAVTFEPPATVTVASAGRHPAVLPLAIPSIPGVSLLDIVPGVDRFGRVHRLVVRIDAPGVVVSPSTSGPVVAGIVGACGVR